MLVLPILYKPTKTGATQQFVASADNGIITISFGQVDGKQQTKDTVCFPKNLNKSNETSAQQQAELEAKSKWEKKLKEGYSLNIEETSAVLLPMKVHTYQDYKNKITFPCYVSPKLDGVNAEYRLLPEPQVLSRGGEQYPVVEARDKAIFHKMEKHNVLSLNGEIYLHGQHLQDIQSAVKKPSADKLKPEFYAFDAPLENGNYQTRIERAELCAVPIEIKVVNSHDEILNWYKHYTGRGFEGIIIRNTDAKYEYNTRSYDVLKLKEAQDKEFKIVSYKLDKNQHPVFECEISKDGARFSVKPKGTDAERKTIVTNINEYIGAWYTIAFETYSKDGIPLKPVGIGLRKCDSNGNPLQ